MAIKLGLDEDEKRLVEVGTVVDPTRPAVRYVPTVDMLRCWRKKPGSTVRILRIAIEEVAKDASVEFLQELDRHRMSKHVHCNKK